MLMKPGQPKKRVVLRAPVFTSSGYGTHARQIAQWLFQHHRSGQIDLCVQPLNWGNTPWHLDAALFGGFIGDLQQRCFPLESADVSVQLALPNEWDPKLAAVNIGVTAAVESTLCSSE